MKAYIKTPDVELYVAQIKLVIAKSSLAVIKKVDVLTS